MSFLFTLLAFVSPLLSPAQQSPISQLKAAYPFGEQVSLDVTADNKRAFVALGAAISILNIESLPEPWPLDLSASPYFIQSFEVPEI